VIIVGTPPVTPARVDRTATGLLLIARDPRSGRLRHPGALDIGLRAALFTDLALAGRLVDRHGAPFVESPAPSGDLVLDAVERAVWRRPDISWWRWFRHVRADRDVLLAELIDNGRWAPGPAGYLDRKPGAAAELAHAVHEVARLRVSPTDARQAMLAALSAMCGSVEGRARPRALRRELRPLVESGKHGDELGAAVLAPVLGGAATLLRRPMRR
jgi:hypothetical protein